MRGPLFEGQPSPSIRKMLHMTAAELKEHVQRMEQEKQYLTDRLDRARAAQTLSPNDQRLRLEHRLARLIHKAKDLMLAKRQASSGYSPGRGFRPRRSDGD